MAFNKLPPDVARELLRHVKPRKARVGGGGSGSSGGGNNKNSPGKTVAACFGLLGFSFSLPYLATRWIGNLTDREEPLTHAQVRRGAFMNSGTRDIGKDPNWDWKNGVYNYPKDFLEHLKKQSPDDVDLGPDLREVIEKDRRERR